MQTYIPNWERLTEKEINEMAQAKKGDWKPGVVFVRNFSEDAIFDLYAFETNLFIPKISKNIMIYKNKHNESYIGGFYDDEKHTYKTGDIMEKHFYAVFSISLQSIKLTSYKQSFVVKGVSVIDDDNFARSGIAYEMYNFFVKTKKYTLVGDSEQYYGARLLWAKLSKNLDLKVDIYDIKKNELLFDNVILHHGKYEQDFDKRLWSVSKDKNNIRSILTEIL